MTTHEQRDAVVHYWFEKAEESLIAARRELEARSLAFATNRLYYACFYAVSALLMTRGLSFKKHSGVRAVSRLILTLFTADDSEDIHAAFP